MNYSDYRRIARENLQGNYWQSVLVSLAAMLLGGLIAGSSAFSVNLDAEEMNRLPRFLIRYFAVMGGISGVLGIIKFVIGGTVQLGYAQYLLKQYNHAHLDIHDLFSQFNRFKEGFLQSFLRSLYIFLWSLLFLIPGIIKSFSYAMTPFIMTENPEMTASEAIEVSKELMDGFKMDLFLLDLSFIGWDLLAVLTLNIGHIFLNPYRNAAHAAYYKDLTAPKAEC